MKRCPTCSRTYADDQNFCFDDGTTLAIEPVSSFDISEAPTANYPYQSGSAPTQIIPATPTTSRSPFYAPPPPPAFTSPYPQQRRSPVPWIVGGLLVLVLGIAAVVFLSSRKAATPSISIDGTTPGASPSYTPTTSSTTSSSSWETLSGDEFSINMPGKPVKAENSVPSAAGPLKLYMYTLNKGYEGFILGYSEYPDAVFTSSQPETILNGAQQGAINNVHGEVVSQREITVNGNPGREIVGVSPAQNTGFTARVILARPRIYMLVYTQYDKSKSISEDGKKFLDSFEITK